MVVNLPPHGSKFTTLGDSDESFIFSDYTGSDQDAELAVIVCSSATTTFESFEDATFASGIATVSFSGGTGTAAAEDMEEYGGDSSVDGDTSLNGTWLDNNGNTWKFLGGKFEVSDDFDGLFLEGTYTTNGNNITMTVTKARIFYESDSIEGSGSSWDRWFTKQEYLNEYGDDDVDELFFTLTGKYSISGNKLTITSSSGTETHTRK
jgi:hypothetical protein